jgi:hypothetical protein
VPACLVDIFARDSKAMAANLCQASVLGQSKSIEGITKLRAVCNSPGIYEAHDAIVEAAACEFGVEAQERLLAVVASTKSYSLVKYDSDAYVDVTRRLRLLNNVRDPKNCAIPLSLQQYRTLSGASELRQLHPREAQVLVDRLVQRGDYQWAVNVATFLGMKTEKILVQWSVAKVITSTDEAAAHKEIVAVLKKCPGAGFTEAALEAAAQGKQRLAVQLLDAEPRSQSQVLLLLQMGLDEIAMEKAVASHDADLTYLVLLKLMHHMPQQAFHAALKRYDAARMQFLAAAQHSPGLTRRANDFLIDAASERHVAAQKIASAFVPPSYAARLLDDAPAEVEEDDEDDAGSDYKIEGTQRVTTELMTEAEHLYTASEATRDEARLCATHRDLLTFQEAMVSKTGDTSVLNLSMTDTVAFAIMNAHEEDAEALRKQFNVPEKKYWYTKLIALVRSGQWDALERMGGVGRYKAVKSPIGFLPFVEVLFDRGESHRAVPFVVRLDKVVTKVEWYVKLDEFQLAVDCAFEDESADLLQQIRKRAQNPSILQYIDERIKALK